MSAKPAPYLDPEPYVDGHFDVKGRFRRFSYPYSTPDHCQACGTRFAPREADENGKPYSQDIAHYGVSS